MTNTDTARQRTIAFPAYDLIEWFGADDPKAPVGIKASRPVFVQMPKVRGGTYWKKFIPGSVVSYTQQYSECPIAALDRARERGHKLHWMNGAAVSVSLMKEAHDTFSALHIGDHVRFEGRLFRLEKAPNDNVELVDLGPCDR